VKKLRVPAKIRSFYKKHEDDYLVATLRTLSRNYHGVVGGGVILFFVLIAILAPFLAPFPPNEIDSQAILQPPSLKHPLGTDIYGRDVFSRIVYAARISLYVGFISVGVGMSIGIIIGATSGYVGSIVDEILMRLMDVLLSFPALLLAILIVSALGRKIEYLMVAIGFTTIPAFARMTRSGVLTEREKEYVLASVADGDTKFHVLFFTILPNCLAPLIVMATINFATAILYEASLSFLGLGVQPPNPSWGRMLSTSRAYLDTAPWVCVFPGLAIMMSVLSLNLLGDGLRDALDPRLQVE